MVVPMKIIKKILKGIGIVLILLFLSIIAFAGYLLIAHNQPLCSARQVISVQYLQREDWKLPIHIWSLFSIGI
jgi:hypothetical protein